MVWKSCQGGYNVKIKSLRTIPASYYCPHCKKLLKKAVQTSDGDRLCDVCFEEIARMPEHTCRECHLTVIPSECYPDMANRKEISRVVVLCDNEDQGCPWTGQLSELEAHLVECQFKKVQCDVCSEFVLTSYLDQHKKEECPLREINCDYCNAVVIARELQTHFGCCQLFPVKCKQCQKTVHRKQLSEHEEKECTHTSCVCGDVVLREKRGEHIKGRNAIFDHMKTLSTAFKSQEDGPIVKEVQAIQGAQKNTTSQLVNVQKDVSVMKERLTRVEGDVRDLKMSMLEPQFRRSQVPMAGKENNDVLELKKEVRELRSFMETIDNRLSKLEDGKSARNYDVPPSAKEVVPYEVMKSELGVNQKLKFLEDKILEVEKTTNILSVHHSELELQLQASLASTHTGEFVWRIPDVQRRIREAKSGRVSSIYSPPFYTGKPGYKMCIRCYLNGDGMGEGRFLSLFFVIMKGEYDALLMWPFNQRVCLELKDQSEEHFNIVQSFAPDPNSSSFLRPKNDMNIASGCPQFAALDDVLGSFIKDDVMFIKCHLVQEPGNEGYHAMLLDS